MKRTALTLIILAGLMLTGCFGGSGEVRYVSKSNPSETLTLNRTRSVKTKVIYSVHGVATGQYTLKTENGTSSGTYTSDGGGIKFRPESGKPESSKIKEDGSFDFAQSTWVVAGLKKDLKVIASSSTR